MVQKDLIYRDQPGRNSYQSGSGGKSNAKVRMSIPFDKKWITEGVDRNAIEYADALGKILDANEISSSQIRNVFGEIKRIELKNFNNEKASFYLLKAKMAYALSRIDNKNKKEAFKELKKAFDMAHELVLDEKTYKNFVDFFEAILAYHKAHGDGKKKPKK